MIRKILTYYAERHNNKHVLYRTTAAPRQSANSCKHDLLLRSPCAFFDRLENKTKKEKEMQEACLFSRKYATFVP